MSIGNLYIISAPSGAGKTSLLSALSESLTGFEIAISHTTRKPREGEENGKHYHFVSNDQFKLGIENNEFLEFAEVFGSFYGTSYQQVNTGLAKGDDVILEIDWQGAQYVRQLLPHAIDIFIMPPSVSQLEERLRRRKQDSNQVIQRRMSQAKEDIAHYTEFQFVIINDNFQQALSELKAIFISQRLTTHYFQQNSPSIVQQLVS